MSEPRTSAPQYVLDFPVLQSHSTEDFVIGESNRIAAELIRAWPAWPGHALMLVGGEGSGKTHLARIWGERADARLVEGRFLAKTDVPAFGRAVVVEGADEVRDREALLHLFNWLKGEGGFLLMTARTAPAHWRDGPADLASRLKAVPVAHLFAPDQAVLAGTLAKQFADRQMAVDAAVISYLASRMERSFAAVKKTVGAIDKLSLKKKARVTIPLVRTIVGKR
jgi:chromosomal replication initiation ATPase DnaA